MTPKAYYLSQSCLSMSKLHKEFIQLDRTFYELGFDSSASFDARMVRLLGEREALRWPDLLREHRVILLSEAGSGKTEEIRNTARRLREEGKPAFFIRIEHIAQDFEGSFEEGTYEEFTKWISTGQEGWILLDSVDEARLRGVGDFEIAIRKLGRRLGAAHQQAHILITSRTAAWRSRTDLELCKVALPFQPVEIVVDADSDQSDQDNVATKDAANKSSLSAPFKIVALDDLQGEQIDTFAKAKGVVNVNAFRDAIERKDAWTLTARPQDLSELIHYWIDKGQIGSRYDLYENSISRRLIEHDQKRRDSQPISKDRLYLGAQLLAAATTLGHQQAIRVPDGADNIEGIPLEDVLIDWDDKDRATLLARPIFDEGAYGTVRFHHREVRELLTAKWLHSLLKDHASRQQIEGLIFKSQYGIEVITPTLRPVLPWLLLFDDKIRDRVFRIAPEVVFEGGDPGMLPLESRKKILRQVCEQIAQPAHGRSMMDYQAVQRFANADLAEEIKLLLEQYGEIEDIAWFLSRMVWHGQIAALTPEVKRLALDKKAVEYTRVAAMRALCEVGSEGDREDVRRDLLAHDAPISRNWLTELAPSLPANEASVDWLLKALRLSVARKRYEVDALADVLSELVVKWPLALLPRWIAGLRRLLATPPVIERRFCEISTQFSWLAPLAAEAILRLVEEKDLYAFDDAVFGILRSIAILDQHEVVEMKETWAALKVGISSWPEMNHALFWYDIAAARAANEAGNANRVVNFWVVTVFGNFWEFDVDAFDTICSDMVTKELEDDRLVALSLAFNLYVKKGRPASWRAKLKNITKADETLNGELHKLLHPSNAELAKWKKQEARWKKQRKDREAKLEKSKKKSKEFITENRDAELTPRNPGSLTRAQVYLYQMLRESDDRVNKLSTGGWKRLVNEFGDDVAQAYRDGAIRYWRHSRPELRSEGKEESALPFSAMFGLEGLEIESQEVPDWAKQLSDEEARIAARLALHEINGFPSWMPSLHAAHPQAVIDLVMQEIDFELSQDDPTKDWHYVLGDVSWSGEWLWDDLTPLVIERLRKPPKNLRALRNLLTIVQGSSISNNELSDLLKSMAHATTSVDSAPVWFAAWVGVEPGVAIPALAARLAEIEADSQKTLFVMRFITYLMGSRRDSSSMRQEFRTVPHMKALLLLVHQYVRESDDIERAGTGVYSPELRDDAQDARSSLFTFLREARGKEAYIALMEIAQAHPNESSRPWMAFQAKEKAIQDADITPWPPGRVREFHDHVERAPGTHRELWELAVSRLNDLRHDLEEGDTSIASVLVKSTEETAFRNYIGDWCRFRASGRYSVAQEDELADAKRPDLRFSVNSIDAPVPIELKIADKWPGPTLHERLEEQLCGDYLRDIRSGRGIFLLIHRGKKFSWMLPSGGRANSFEELIEALQAYWTAIAPRHPGVDEIKVIGIDLTKRGARAKEARSRVGAKSKKAAKKVVNKVTRKRTDSGAVAKAKKVVKKVTKKTVKKRAKKERS